MSITTVVLGAVAGVLFLLYVVRRNARLKADE
jgi:hypothetical protein